METPKPITLGSSLLVPSVQELAKQPLVEVPPRYVRPDQDPPIIFSESDHDVQTVPVIDLQSLLSPEPLGDLELERLHSACKEWGFFQLVNHGVNTSLVEKVKSEIQDFFRLPMEEKKKYWQKEGDVEGFGQAFVLSEEQKLDWADLFFMITLPRHARKPHLFPELPLPLRDTIESYSSELKNLAMSLLEQMSRALHIETKVMTKLFEDGMQNMRMNYYPPCPQPELVIGLTPHSDAVGLTILLQVNEIEGLQIKKEGKWVPIKPLPNSFIVNIGDILEIVTNGIYSSVEHRAIVNLMKERLSVATFHSPKIDGEIGPVPCLITPHTPALFRRVGVVEYYKHSSMLVPSVQELAKQSLAEIPPRYVRPDQDPPIVSESDDVSITTRVQAVPVIDLQSLLSPEPIRDLELEKLHSACKEWGFFQLVNHGVNSSLVEKVKSEVHKFFKLPMEAKKKYWQEEGEVEGFGQAFVVSKEQKLDWADMFFMVTLPPHDRKPHLFPKLPLPLRDTIESYSLDLKNLVMTLLELMAKALQIDAKELTELFEDGRQSMRMNFYPPCPQPELVIGLRPHSDPCGLTILLQLNEMEGLQIRKEGIWIPIKPLPNAFIVNIGDIMEIVTNGIYSSVEHRATVNAMKERLSVATFYSPKQEREIGPASSLITPYSPALFKKIGVENYIKERFSRELNGKSFLDVMRIQGEEGNIV
ncbi:Oxoglutarate/iron-dependent dioxygenase [Macleaya cordata]|uniref:Oxoglutarate/iron-dependent dioxygenase n=1 Tax=Macleaya cordata TaxID=56857 RepID=A0A200R8G1_MACCD|nr:Oxoglutarate/iron-dependent dioxygenase [Macleaya cordata]